MNSVLRQGAKREIQFNLNCQRYTTECINNWAIPSFWIYIKVFFSLSQQKMCSIMIYIDRYRYILIRKWHALHWDMRVQCTTPLQTKERFKMREFTRVSIFKHSNIGASHRPRLSLQQQYECLLHSRHGGKGYAVWTGATSSVLDFRVSLGPFLKCSIMMSYRFQLILLVSAANIIHSHKPDNLSNMC